MSVFSYVAASDGRLTERLLEWHPPRWVRLWMLGASRLGDGWLWLLASVLLAATGPRAVPVLWRAALSAACANLLLVLVKGRVHRVRPCEGRRPVAFDVNPLAWFPSGRFSFPSGHALNAFAVGSVIALSFPPLAVPVLVAAASVAASRVVLGLHWLSDVLTGAAVGSLIGIAVGQALPC